MSNQIIKLNVEQNDMFNIELDLYQIVCKIQTQFEKKF